MPLSNRMIVAAGLLAIDAVAGQSMNMCNGFPCDNCPSAITTAGTGWPQCVIYERDLVLGGAAGEFEMHPDNPNNRIIWFDIPEHRDAECRYIIRSPAGPADDGNCGRPIYSNRGGVCVDLTIEDTFMVQFCCGTGPGSNCRAAGAGRVQSRDGMLASHGAFSSIVLTDDSGNLIVPSQVGDRTHGDMMDVFMEDFGLNASTVARSKSTAGAPIFRLNPGAEKSIERRRCGSYTPNGAPFTRVSSQSYRMTSTSCEHGGGTIMNEQSVSRTTSFSSSISDPWGVVSVEVGFDFEESQSQSVAYEWSPQPGQCGFLSWTPTLLCSSGTIVGCGPDEEGEVCTADVLDLGEINGFYSFVRTS